MLMLDELKKSGYPEKGEMKKFFTLLSDALRHYIEARYEIPVLDRTTNELFVEMKKSAMGPSIMDTVKQILVFSDLVKFAKMMPAVDESGNMLEKTYDIIKVMHQAFENQFKESEKA